MSALLFIAVGGALGALARYMAAYLVQLYWAGSWPLATLLINVLGSALIGVVFVLIERSHWHAQWQLVLMVGFLGAFTTFSTFALESVQLIQAGHAWQALAYMLGSAFSCVLAAAAGLAVARALLASG